MDANDLAPSKLKNLRDEREQKYLREQVLLDAPAGFGTIIAKSHKVCGWCMGWCVCIIYIYIYNIYIYI